ncbi:MAG: Gfo/Idh/MocA family protein [Pirellulaceae bacterium]
MPKRNRRQFMEESMMATAAAVAASSTGTLFADEERPSHSPNEKLGVAVVGVRGRGKSHLGAFAGRRDTEVLYVCDADRRVGGTRVEQVAKRQGRRPRFYEDLRRVLEDKRVDIVSIATPDHWHALMAIWAMQSGADVYTEIPVSHNVSEGRRVVEAARKYTRICQTGTQCRSNPGMMEAMDFVANGHLGHVKIARGLCYRRRKTMGPSGNYPVPSSVNYDLWLGPAPEAPLTRPSLHHDWRWQWSYGNGDLGNQGIHQIDVARWGLGVQRLSDAVISYGGRFGNPDAGETANTQVVVHDYGDQSLVFESRSLPSGSLCGVKVGVIFEATDGYLVMTSYDGGVAFDLDGRKIRAFQGSGNHFESFLKTVRSRNLQDLSADIEEGHLSSSLGHMANVSYRLGEFVSEDELVARLCEFPASENLVATFDRTRAHLTDHGVDLASDHFRLGCPLMVDASSETFVDHDLANAMLTREYRAPFAVPQAGQV